MYKIPGKMKLLSRLISLSATGLLVASAGVAYAAGDSQSSTNQQQSQQQQNEQKVNAPQFSDVDQDRDQRLIWTEIYTFYDDELDRAGWQEQDVMNQHDLNQNAGLDENEYVIFVTTLAAEPGSNISQAQSQPQSQGLSQDQQSNQSPADGQAMTENEQDQELLTDRQADPGSAEYYDEQDTDTVAESYEQDVQEAQPADIASDQQQQDQGQDEMANTQGQQPSQDQEMAGSTGQGNQAQQSDATGDQSQAADGTTTTIIAITDIPDISVEDLEDRKVVNLNGEDIGEVEEVIFGTDGAVTGLVVGVGGFWDIGDKDVYANAAEIRVSGDQLVWETTLDEESLEELPEYETPEVSIIE